MKAVIYTEYGPPDVLQIKEVEKPTHKDDEVLVKVRASSVNPAEWYGMTGLFLARIGGGLLKPKDTRLSQITPRSPLSTLYSSHATTHPCR